MRYPSSGISSCSSPSFVIFMLFQHNLFFVCVCAVSDLSVFNLNKSPPAGFFLFIFLFLVRGSGEDLFLLFQRNVFNHMHFSTRLNSEPFTANQQKMGQGFHEVHLAAAQWAV